LILLLVVLAALGGYAIGSGLVPTPAKVDALGTVTVWLAVGLFGSEGSQVMDTSPIFESKDECVASVEFAQTRPRTIAISPCYEIKLLPVKTTVSVPK
jgi:hypothetical protein